MNWKERNPLWQEAYNARRRKPKQSRTCEECGSPFQTSRNIGPNAQRFCSVDCREIVRHRRPGKSVGARTRWRIFQRDPNCYLCQLPIDLTLKWPHPLSATVDHYIPRSAGGSGRLDNLRAAHWHCNKNKAERLPGTEIWVAA